MSSGERIGTNIVSRLVDRLTGRRRPHVILSTEGQMVGTVGGFYERAAAWQEAHGRDWQQEAWENSGRWKRYLATSICEAHIDGPQKH